MSERVIQTAAGPLSVSVANEDLVNFVGSRWRLPILTQVPREDAHTTHNLRAEFYVPLAHGGRHVDLFYASQSPRRREEAQEAAAATAAASDALLLRVLRSDWPGLAVIMSALRETEEGCYPGVAVVVGDGKGELAGTTHPVRSLLDSLEAGELAFELFEGPRIVHPAVAGEVTLSYAVLEGSAVLCFKPTLDPSDPSLIRLVEAGVKALVHMPVVGTRVPEIGAPLPLPEAPPPALLAEVSPNGLRRVYRLVARMAGCDGEVHPSERAFLNGVAERFGLASEEVTALEVEAVEGRELRVGPRPAERSLLLHQLIEVALADGVLDPRETKRLLAFADSFGVPRDELQGRLDERLCERTQAASGAGRESAPAPAETEQTGRVLILDAEDCVVGLNLLSVAAGPTFLGFKQVPPGVHRFSLTLPDGHVTTRWARLLPSEVLVLALEGRELIPPTDSPRFFEVWRGAIAGRFDDRLRSFVHHLPWRSLTAPLGLRRFPPVLYAPPSDRASTIGDLFEAHEGRGSGVLAEVAFSYLVGFLDSEPRAKARWQDILQAFYSLPAEVAEQAPWVFTWFVALTVEHQGRLPLEVLRARNPVTAGSHRLSDRLIESGVPELVEAGRRWAVFIAGHHADAPPAQELPRSLTAPTFAPHEAETLDAYRAEIAKIEREGDSLDPRLVFPLSNLANLQGLAGDTLGALASVERLLSVAIATGQSSEFLIRTHRWLARLQREAGRPAEAAAQERMAEAIAQRN